MTRSKKLVRYAGYDFDYQGRRFLKPDRALMMFRNGKDTTFIADHFGVKEHTVERWISTARSEDLGLSNPYGATS